MITDNKKIFKKYEVIDHLSDVKVRVYGTTIKELFENAAEGMFSLVTDLGKVKKMIKKDIIINIKGKVEPEDFLIIWLEKLLILCEVKGLVFSYFKIADLINNGMESIIKGSVKGEKINLEKHEVLLQIKAPTYHGLHIRQENKTGIYNVEIIFDV
jgi:SHS2 domain-containing protein